MNDKLKYAIGWTAMVVICAMLIYGIYFLNQESDKSNELNQECCEKVCGDLGLDCVRLTWIKNHQTVQCSFNYKLYGFDNIEELFTFRLVNQTCKEALE